MEFENCLFDIEFTGECIEEMAEIYIYISQKLNQINSAKQIISMVYERVSNLSKNPELYMKIGKVDKLK